MTKFALIVIAVLAFASLCQALPLPDELEEFDNEFELLNSGYEHAVAALESEGPANQARLNAFKREYAEQIQLLKEGIANGSITLDTLDNSEQYQKVKAEIQQLTHKGQLGVSADEIVDGVKKGVGIGKNILTALSPLTGLFG